MPQSACAIFWPNGSPLMERRAGRYAIAFGTLLFVLGLRAVAAVVLT